MRSSPIASKCFGVLLAAVLGFLSASEAGAQTLWYNGNDNGVDSFFSTVSTSYSGIVYDDFTVTSSGGWQVNGVFGNFLGLGTVNSANWVVLSGVSAGNAGTVVASGTGAATSIGSADGFGNTLYNVSVTGLNFNLAPGTYWLGLQPISPAPNYGYLVTTSGADAIGTPAGNDGDAFYSDNSGDYFQSAITNGSADDFSLGVTGVPEPSLGVPTLICLGLIAALRARLRRV